MKLNFDYFYAEKHFEKLLDRSWNLSFKRQSFKRNCAFFDFLEPHVWKWMTCTLTTFFPEENYRKVVGPKQNISMRKFKIV